MFDIALTLVGHLNFLWPLELSKEFLEYSNFGIPFHSCLQLFIFLSDDHGTVLLPLEANKQLQMSLPLKKMVENTNVYIYTSYVKVNLYEKPR